MGLWNGCQIVSIVFVVLSVTFLVWAHFNTRQLISVNAETHTTIIHRCIKNSIEASKIPDAFYALLKVTEARVCIETLSKISGGDVCLGDMTGTNIMHILNTLNFQEQQIRSRFPMKENHPLAAEIA